MYHVTTIPIHSCPKTNILHLTCTITKHNLIYSIKRNRSDNNKTREWSPPPVRAASGARAVVDADHHQDHQQGGGHEGTGAQEEGAPAEISQ